MNTSVSSPLFFKFAKSTFLLHVISASLSSYSDGKLQLLQSFIYDAQTNEEHPWFFSTSSEYEVTPDAAPIEESDVLYNIALYPEKLVTLEPFF